MLKRMSIRKIAITSISLVAFLLVYLIPNKDLKIKEHLEYINTNVETSPVYLMNSNNYLTRNLVAVSSKTIEEKALELLEVLIVEGKGESKIPSGFRSIIPSDTEILSIKYDHNVLKVDFSESLLNVSKENEEKVIEAIIYTLTSIDEVKEIIIYVNSEILTSLPKSKITLPSTLDRNFGINKEYNLTSLKNVNHVTVYYISKFNDDIYYVPVTKYLNDSRQKIEIIVDELTTHTLLQTNLMSYLNSNTELLKTSNELGVLNLTFNNYIFDDFNEENILEEVIYTICLSINDNYDVNEVVFNVDKNKVYNKVLKEIK